MTHSLSHQSQAIIDAFGHRPDVTAGQVATLQKALNDSPELTAQFTNRCQLQHRRERSENSDSHFRPDVVVFP